MQKMQEHFSALHRLKRLLFALIHAIHGVMQNLHSCHPWQSVTAVKTIWAYLRRPVKRVIVPSSTLSVLESNH